MLKKKFFKSSDEVEVTFEYEAEAAEALLLCEANNWQPVAMSKVKKGGPFRTKLRLPKDGRFQFRYLLDGQSWVNDDAADEFVHNQYGGQNSVVSTSPSAN